MADETPDRTDAAQQEREMREHEREAQERDPDEGSPEERGVVEPGAPAFPVQKSPGS
ncbi:MAG TPA: hypothetical protein VN213_14535 [Solirubrobacteraceae bacterium]|nr:hypothetical protein [Solirubrobacteraceae bacterium]